MKKIVAILMVMIMVISVTVVLAGGADKETQQSKVPVIIGFKDTPGPADKAMVRGQGGDIKHSYTIIDAIAAKLPEPAIENIRKSPRVKYVEMDGEVHAHDLELDNSWGVKRIGAGTVHESGNTGAGVKVAIIDTGIDYNHPDLDANFDTELLGYDFVNDDADPMDDAGHGTHCAGIVAAEDNDVGVVGVVGVAPDAHLYGVKVLDSTGSGSSSDVIAGIDWSVENGMEIISMSLGGGSYLESMEAACDAAYDADIVVVASAGNSGNPRGRGDNVGYPARYDSVIAVAATDSNDVRARWSSTGPDVELAAPGVSIYSTYKGGEYVYMDGTSMACPHVAGTAALAIASGESNVRQCLQATAEDLGATGKDNLYGHGLVNADEAVLPTEPNTPPVADANGPYTGDEGSSIEFDGSGSSDPAGTIDFYEWDFGDGTTETGSNPTHAYADNGEYTVTLTVTDDDGGTGTDNADATISNVAPTADAGGPYTGYVGQAVTFAGSATDPGTVDVLTYEWDFDYDGETFVADVSGVDLTNPSHTYDSEGPYTVALRVEDDDSGISSISTASVTVTAPDEEAPVITGATGDIDGTTGEPVTISATITDNVGVVSATVHYTPIDGTETTVSMIEGASVWSADVPVASDKVGTITYYITAQDATPKTARDPTEGTYSITVTDKDVPVAEAGSDQDVLVKEEVTFDGSGSSDNIGITSYSWDFDASDDIGEDATGVMVTHIYTTAGTYTVTLTVSDDACNEASDTLTVAVTEAPANTMRVASIDMSTTKYKAQGWLTYAIATVKIVDATGDPVNGANVFGTWSGLTDASDSGSTDSNGKVSLNSDSVKNARGTFTFAVTVVEHPELTYTPNANEETSDSITV